MKTILLVIFCLVWTVNLSSAFILVDSNAVRDFDAGNIPDYWIEQVKSQNILIQFPGRSHAQQLVGDGDDLTPSIDPPNSGLEMLEAIDSKYQVQIECEPPNLNQLNALWLSKAQFSTNSMTWRPSINSDECRTDTTGYWSSSSGDQYTINSAQEMVSQGKPFDASIFGWSNHIVNTEAIYAEGFTGRVTFNEIIYQDYVSSMNLFTTTVPQTQFVYATAPSDDDSFSGVAYVGEDGWRLTYYNQRIRDDALAADGILFDQAEIENWDDTFTSRRVDTWFDSSAGVTRNLQLSHEDWNADGTCAHAASTLCVAKAKAIWWLAAHLAGWDGTPACHSTSDCGGNSCVQGVCQGGAPSCIDGDSDGYNAYHAITCPSGTDCDDTTGGIRPGLSDSVCNGIDNDCDGFVDEDYVSVTSCFLPGQCALSNVASSCSAGVVTSCSTGAPGTEVCGNSVDEDCNGVNEACVPVCVDTDNDGYSAISVDCPVGTDCNDNDYNTNPSILDGACNNVDNDCDGLVDEDYVSDISCFLPGVCTLGNVASSCSAGVVTSCSTGTPVAEICDNSIDEDCNGSDLACPVGDLDGNGVVNLRDLDAVITLRDLLILGRALLS